jgi:hypothetical protein
MNWLMFGIGAAAAALAMTRRGVLITKIRRLNRTGPEKAPVSQAPDPSELAADDLDGMLAALPAVTGPLDRHRLYLRIVDAAYREREAVENREICLEYGQRYIDELPQMEAALREAHDGELPPIPVFKQMAITLEEDGDFEGGIAVSEKALAHEVDDGTKTGFAGRIKRLQKKMAAPE